MSFIPVTPGWKEQASSAGLGPVCFKECLGHLTVSHPDYLWHSRCTSSSCTDPSQRRGISCWLLPLDLLSTQPCNTLCPPHSSSQLSCAPQWEENLPLLHVLKAGGDGSWSCPFGSEHRLWGPRRNSAEDPLALSLLFFPAHCTPQPLSHFDCREIGLSKQQGYCFYLTMERRLCTAPFSIYLTRLWDFGDVLNSPARGPGLKAHVLWGAALSAVHKNEGRASRHSVSHQQPFPQFLFKWKFIKRSTNSNCRVPCLK